jgi:hypothetical protein
MREGLTWRLLSLLASVLLLAACGGPGARDATDDAALHQDISSNHPGSEVTFDGTVDADPVQVGDHEHLTVTTPLGDVLEVDHNTSLATSVPVHKGDHVTIHGLLYIDPGPHPGVHCTHAHTSSGCPLPGWIELSGNYYE